MKAQVASLNGFNGGQWVKSSHGYALGGGESKLPVYNLLNRNFASRALAVEYSHPNYKLTAFWTKRFKLNFQGRDAAAFERAYHSAGSRADGSSANGQRWDYYKERSAATGACLFSTGAGDGSQSY